MIKKTITYTDYDGVQRTENFYFNLNKAELMDMELTTPDGGLRNKLRAIMDKRDIPGIIRTIKEFIMAGFGEKSPDGRKFVKSKALSEAFMQTEAYAELYMELISDANATAAFINGMIPEELRANLENTEKETQPDNVSLLSDAVQNRED